MDEQRIWENRVRWKVLGLSLLIGAVPFVAAIFADITLATIISVITSIGVLVAAFSSDDLQGNTGDIPKSFIPWALGVIIVYALAFLGVISEGVLIVCLGINLCVHLISVIIIARRAVFCDDGTCSDIWK